MRITMLEISTQGNLSSKVGAVKVGYWHEVTRCEPDKQ